jgi:hypothetical protein
MAHSSIGNMTNTLIETGSRHMQQCRTNYDVLLTMAGDDEDQMLNNDDKWCMGKDELAVSCGKHIMSGAAVTASKYAYPSVVTTLGDLKDEDKTMFAAHYHFMGTHASSETLYKDVFSKAPDSSTLSNKLKQLRTFTPVGYSVGRACAHPAKGDTVASVQIGGLRTVFNGGFEVQTGDMIQMYMPEIESNMFLPGGGRRASTAHMFKTTLEDETQNKTSKTTEQRKNYYNRGNGIKGGINSSSRVKTGMFSIKPYLESQNEKQYQYSGDKIRVFAKAVSSARPYEPVDIMISRQSL